MRDTVSWYLNRSTFRDFELIVVDQSDSADGELERLANEDTRLRYFKVDFRGMTRGRNFGVAQARTDLIVFSEDDVVPTDNYLHVYFDHFSSNPGSNGATGPVLMPGQVLRSYDQLSDLERSQITPERVRLTPDVDFSHSAVFGAGGNSAYRRNAVIQIGGFDEAYVGNAWGEDREFGYRFRKTFGSIDYLPQASVVHLACPGGGSRALPTQQYIRDFCSNSLYTNLRTNADISEVIHDCWCCLRRLAVNKDALRHPSIMRVWSVFSGLFNGVDKSHCGPKLPFLRTRSEGAFSVDAHFDEQSPGAEVKAASDI